jgi:hypothetical protein
MSNIIYANCLARCVVHSIIPILSLKYNPNPGFFIFIYLFIYLFLLINLFSVCHVPGPREYTRNSSMGNICFILFKLLKSSEIKGKKNQIFSGDVL